jgi:DNA-binding transcriptional ArsR family regulator
MQGISGEMLEALAALAAVPPAVLRALAEVPVEALQALGEAREAALQGRLPAGNEGSAEKSETFTGAYADPAATELQASLKQVDALLQQADVDVVMTFGKWRDPKDPNRTWSWWNGWIDSGGGGVTRLLQLPDFKVAEVFSVLGSEVRLAILRSLLDAPKSAAELVAELGLGTTGQAYHHLQELIRAGFVEARAGRYHLNGKSMRAYFSALTVAADLVPKASEEPEGGG